MATDVIVIAKPAPGYRIVEQHRVNLVQEPWFELQYQEPAYLTWQEVFEGPSVAHCRLAYDQLTQGDPPQYWEDMDVAE